MLARLGGIAGVQGISASVGNPEGALIGVSVRPGADPAKVAAEVRRVLSEALKERSPVQLTSPAADAALRQKQWLGPGQLADLAASDPGTPEGRAPVPLVALLLGAAVVVLGLLGWRHLRRRGDDPSRPRPGLAR